MKRIVLGISVLALFLSMGCATVMKGTSQDVTIDSNPQGAQVFVDGGIMGETPLTLNLKKNAYDNIMVKKEGFKTQNIPLEKSFDGVAILNIFWDLSTTDLITGAIYEYKPNQYFFELKEDGSD
ncbi:MAG: PEGA domain-containing protein [bacterium]